MELRDLQYFAVVAEHQNIGRAAEALGLSATALSKCLRRLEKSVGAKLVRRASRGVALTTVGAALLTRIGPLQGMLNDVQHEAADLAQGHAGHITVGTGLGGAASFVADACVSLLRESATITLRVSPASTRILIQGLRNGEIDFCVTDPRPFSAAAFEYEHLFDDPFVIIASAHHRLAKQKWVSIADIAGERWASTNGIATPQWQSLLRTFEDHKLPALTVALDTNTNAARIPAIAFSNLLGIGSKLMLRRHARQFPLVELPVKEFSHVRRMSIVYRKGAYLSPAAQSLIAILQAQAKDMSDDAQEARSTQRVARIE